MRSAKSAIFLGWSGGRFVLIFLDKFSKSVQSDEFLDWNLHAKVSENTNQNQRMDRPGYKNLAFFVFSLFFFWNFEKTEPVFWDFYNTDSVFQYSNFHPWIYSSYSIFNFDSFCTFFVWQGARGKFSSQLEKNTTSTCIFELYSLHFVRFILRTNEVYCNRA